MGVYVEPTDRDGNIQFLWLFFDITVCNTGVICHESFHATFALLQRKGVVLSDISEEAFAYTLEYIVKQCEGFWKEAKKEYRNFKKDLVV